MWGSILITLIDWGVPILIVGGTIPTPEMYKTEWESSALLYILVCVMIVDGM